MEKRIWRFGIEQTRDFENGYYLTSSSSRLAKAIAHWELYKRIAGLPGDIVECGVYKGASLIRFATFREMLESQSSRKIIGFDAFGSFPPALAPEDNRFIEKFEAEGGPGIPYDELVSCFKHKGFTNFEFVMGDAARTVPDYALKHPAMKISLLHIDVDVYAPTKVILENFFDKVVRDGIIIFDDYGTVPGETRAP